MDFIKIEKIVFRGKKVCWDEVERYLYSQTNGVRPNKKVDYQSLQSTLLFGLHAVFCLSELSRVREAVNCGISIFLSLHNEENLR